jgi:hypothetical protein
MQKFPLELTKLLYMRFASTYGEKFVKNHPNDEFVKLWWEEWSEGMAGIDPNHVKEGLSYCRLNLDWPPSIAEFRRICESFAGIPSPEKSLADAIRGDFNHPITAMAYDKVGSWAMKTSKQTDLLSVFKAAYVDALAIFRVNPDDANAKLESFNHRKAIASPATPPPVSQAEQKNIGWKEQLKQYRELANAEKPADHPQWDKGKITIGSKSFDETLYKSRREYLLALGEEESLKLSTSDQYDRIRFIRENIASVGIERYTPSQPYTKEEIMPTKRYYGPRKVSHYWNS